MQHTGMSSTWKVLLGTLLTTWPVLTLCRYRDYGFVHFKERQSALDAVQKSQDAKPQLDGKELQVGPRGSTAAVAALCCKYRLMLAFLC
jgi:hypothetical protein